MPSKFGGVPVQHAGSKFGGVPIGRPDGDEYYKNLESLQSQGTIDLAQQQELRDYYSSIEPSAKKQPTFGDRAQAVGETAINMGAGLIGGTLGMAEGNIEGIAREMLGGGFGTAEGADRAQAVGEKRAEQGTNTVKSAIRTVKSAIRGAIGLGYDDQIETVQDSPLGKKYTENVGEAMAPLAAVAPLAELSALSSATRAPMFKKMSPTKERFSEQLANTADGTPINAAAESLIAKKPKSVKAAKDYSIKQGVDEGTIDLIVTSSQADKALYRRALAAIKAGREQTAEGKLSKLTTRPGDAAGDALYHRFSVVQKLNREAGTEINQAAKGLEGKKVDLTKPYDDFKNALQDLGVSIIEEKGKLKGLYDKSEFARSKTTQNTLNDYLNRVRSPETDAILAHRLKRVIDNDVEYSPLRPPKNPIAAKGESLLKDLRRGINEQLQGLSTEYSAANTKYAKTRESIDNFYDAVGPSFNATSENAGKRLANTIRSLMSHNQKRIPAQDAIDGLQRVAQEYGIKFNDDIMRQSVFMDELESMFGSSASTSFGGQIERAVTKAGEKVIGDVASGGAQGGLYGAATEGAKALYRKSRGINEANLIKALEELTR